MLFNIKWYMVISLLAVSHMVSASVWSPTASDVNFFAFGPFSEWTQTGNIGIFEDTDGITATSIPIAEFTSGATVTFTSNESNWDITVDSEGVEVSTKTLLNSDRFQLGWFSNGAWISEVGKNLNPWTPNFWRLTFVDSAVTYNNTETLYVTNIDLAPQRLQNGPVTTAPLPAAAWSFMAGIMGLLAFGKHRHH